MIQLWKETLLPGSQVEAKSKRWFTITAEDVKAGNRNINKMVRRGRNIPLVFEHQNVEENDEDDWKANYARNTFGKVGGAKISTEADVTAGIAKQVGTLLVRHDIYDQKSADAVKRAGFVSPKIYRNYEDSQGMQYEGLTIAHVAATPTACQFWQTPFQLSDDDAMYLSYTPPDDETDDDFAEPEAQEECPGYLRNFDSWLDECLALSTTETEEGAPVADENESEETETESEGGGGMGGDVKALIKALRNHGLNISDKVKSIPDLVIAVESNGGGSSMDEPAEPLPPENPDEGADTTSAGGPPMMMSTLDKNPKKRERACKEAVAERQEAVKRIDAAFATGRVDGPKKRALTRQATGVEMSFTATGEAGGKSWTKLLSDIAEIEKNPANSVLSPTPPQRDASGKELSTVAKPDHSTRKTPTPEEAQRGVDVILGKTTAQAAWDKK